MIQKTNLIQKIKNKIIDKTATVVANNFMGGNKAKRAIRQSNYDAKTLQADRARGGNMPYPADESNPQFRTMVQANEVRGRLKRNAQ